MKAIFLSALSIIAIAQADAQTETHLRHSHLYKGPKSTAQKIAASDATAEKPAAQASPNWVTRCASATRDAPLECSIEQSAVMTKTGQLIVLVSIRVPSSSRTPVMLVQIPLGVFLPGGIRLQVDNGDVETLPLQTCEQRGCFAGEDVSPQFIGALSNGKQLKVAFQDLHKQTIALGLPLGDFGTAFAKIK